MDKKCIDCKYFKQGSVGPTKTEHVWGDCLKAADCAGVAENPAGAGVFTWADGSCDHFESRTGICGSPR
ncbi:MAG: hypothetical protein CEE38_18555 [Planctomycetes bacterium B3_Pla]|nr:MAG: hypothetical protein CEE38_18555 [Planctomycetes bacterium B3_Pla]